MTHAIEKAWGNWRDAVFYRLFAAKSRNRARIGKEAFTAGFKAGVDSVDISIKTMQLSGDREEYYTCISCDGRQVTTNRYPQGYHNRAQYEVDELRHVILGEAKPNIADPIYADGYESMRADT